MVSVSSCLQFNGDAHQTCQTVGIILRGYISMLINQKVKLLFDVVILLGDNKKSHLVIDISCHFIKGYCL